MWTVEGEVGLLLRRFHIVLSEQVSLSAYNNKVFFIFLGSARVQHKA